MNNINNNNNMNDDNNNNNTRPKRLSSINATKLISSINKINKRKFNDNDPTNNNNNNNNNTAININDVNNNINQSKSKQTKYVLDNNTINNINNNSIVNVNNVLIPVILSNCLSYLQLKELNLIITRVNKYWANHIFNNVTLGYRCISLEDKQYKLLSQYFQTINNTRNNNNNRNNNDNNKAVNLLNQIKYSSDLLFISLSSIDLFLNIIKRAECIKQLTLYYGRHDESFNPVAKKDTLWDNIRLDKLESLAILDPFQAETPEVCDVLLRKLMKCIDLNKIKDIVLGKSIPIRSQPLKVFEKNPFTNLTDLKLSFTTVINDSMNYLSNLVQLRRLYLEFSTPSFKKRISLDNWNWLIKLINLEEFSTKLSGMSWSKLEKTNCLKALITLPKLITLNLNNTELLNSSNKCLQLFSQFKHLTSLSTSVEDQDDSPLITFPTISTLTDVTIEFGEGDCIIPILKSNPQINCIDLNVTASDLVEILQIAPNLLQYRCNSMFDYTVIPCCETYPYPLVTNTSFNSKKFVNVNARQQLISRIETHLEPGYTCSTVTCNNPSTVLGHDNYCA